MAALPLLPSPLPHLPLSPFFSFYSPTHFRIPPTCSISTNNLHKTQNPKPPKASTNGDQNNSPPPTKPNRRGRKKTPTSSSPSTKKTKQPPKSKIQNTAIESTEPATIIEDEENYDDGIDFPYEDPPLVCCFGAARKEFVPTVRVSEEQMDADIYSEWKMLQWKPPEFARAPGGAPSNVAVAHVRLGGRAAFMGKVGDDEFGDEMVYMMNKERVQTRAVKFDGDKMTGCAQMRIGFEEGKMRAETVEAAAEDSLLGSELNLAVLKEAGSK